VTDTAEIAVLVDEVREPVTVMAWPGGFKTYVIGTVEDVTVKAADSVEAVTPFAMANIVMTYEAAGASGWMMNDLLTPAGVVCARVGDATALPPIRMRHC
jgi:hypothetical protein